MKKKVIFVPVVDSFITAFMGSGLTLAIPAMAEQYRISAGTAGWAVTAYMLTCGILTLPFGRFADRIDRKTILVIGTGVFAGASLAGGFSVGFAVLLLIRILQGIGASMIFSTGLALLTDSAEEGSRGRLIGLHTAAMYAGLSLGPAAGGMITMHFGWKWLFILTGICGSGAFFCSLKLISGKDSAGIGAGGKASYLTDLPVLIRNRALVCGALAVLINCCANYAVTYLLSLYMQITLGYTAQNAGLVLIAFPAAQALFSPWMGKLSDRITPQNLAAAGMAVTTAVMAILAWLPSGEHEQVLWILIGILAVGGTGCAVFAAPNARGVMASVPPDAYGVTGGLLSAMRSLGNTCSMAVISLTGRIYMGTGSLREAAPEGLMQAMEMTFLILCGLCILGIYVAIQRKI